MLYVLYTIHVAVCLFLIMVVLLQQGKGADLSVFGGGGTQTAFGARGAATLLHKLTVFSFIAFIITTVGIGFLKAGGTTGSVMDSVVEEEAAPEPAGGEPVTGDEATTEGAAAPAGDASPPPAADLPEPEAESIAPAETETPASETEGSGG